MDSGGEEVRGHSTEEGDDASSVCQQFSRQCCFSKKTYLNTQDFPSLGHDIIWGNENQNWFLEMMQFLDSILPHQVECGAPWSKLLSADPEIDLKEVILILKWDFREIIFFENFLQARKQTFPSAVTLDVLGGKKKKSQRAGGAFSGWWMLLQGSKFLKLLYSSPTTPSSQRKMRPSFKYLDNWFSRWVWWKNHKSQTIFILPTDTIYPSCPTSNLPSFAHFVWLKQPRYFLEALRP